MCVHSEFVKSTVHHHYGRTPKRSFVTQAFTAACLLRDGLLGVNTATQAAIACGVAPSYVSAATIILNSRDEALAVDVLTGRVPLLQAAGQVQNCAALVAAFKNATPADRAAFGRTVGVSELFDSAIAPAIDHPTGRADVLASISKGYRCRSPIEAGTVSRDISIFENEGKCTDECRSKDVQRTRHP